FETAAVQPPAQNPPGGGDPQPDPGGTAAPAGPAPSVVDRTAPVITGLRAHRGPRLTFTLSEYAVVRVVITRRGNTAHLRKVGTLTRVFKLGPARLSVRRIGRQVLRPGSYVATVTATDAAHNRSHARSVRFQVRR